MRVRVKFRYNAHTGEVEAFTVDAVDADASEADHDRRHDSVAADVAQVVERGAWIEPVEPAPAAHRATDPDEAVAARASTASDEAGSQRVRGPAEEPRRG